MQNYKKVLICMRHSHRCMRHTDLSPMVIDICIPRIYFGCHVEVLGRQLWLLLLHVHAATFYQSIRSQLQNDHRSPALVNTSD